MVDKERREFIVDSTASLHMTSKNDLTPAEREIETFQKSKETVKLVIDHEAAYADAELRVYVNDLDMFIEVSYWKTHLQSYRLGDRAKSTLIPKSGESPYLTKNGTEIRCRAENHVPMAVHGVFIIH